MSQFPPCPKCEGTYTYQDGNLIICPECAHEWTEHSQAQEEEVNAIRDAHGAVLQDGDNVVIIKDLKIKGSSSVAKQGTIVKNIKLVVDGHDGHNINCRIDGIGNMDLKSEFVKKA